MAKNERFVITYKKTTLMTETKILVDRETGVNYLYHESGCSGGLTPLLDREGRPIVTSTFDLEE